MAPAAALKVAEVAPAATVTDAGTVRVELVLVKVTVAPPVGAAWVRVTVHVLEEFGPRLAGLQASKETSAVAADAGLSATSCIVQPLFAVPVAA
jgi:hypothetical protein